MLFVIVLKQRRGKNQRKDYKPPSRDLTGYFEVERE